MIIITAAEKDEERTEKFKSYVYLFFWKRWFWWL